MNEYKQTPEDLYVDIVQAYSLTKEIAWKSPKALEGTVNVVKGLCDKYLKMPKAHEKPETIYEVEAIDRMLDDLVL